MKDIEGASPIDAQVVRLATLPLEELKELVIESEAGGLRLVRRLHDDWLSGENRFDQPGEALFGAYVGEQLVAVCGVNVDPFAGQGAQADGSVPARLRHLYVKVSHRGRGLGRRLVAQACRTAAQHFKRIQLRTRSTEAGIFYERLGFLREQGLETVTHARALRGPDTELLLIRHAESQPSESLPELDWPLSERGNVQAKALARALSQQRIDRLVSSPYRRAEHTLRPYAEQHGLPIEIVSDLRERKLSDGARSDWLALLARAWSDFSFALPGCETSAACQRRVSSALQRIVQFREGERIAVASHGNAIGLFLNRLDATFDFAAWRAMKNPDLFRIIWAEGGPRWLR